MSGIEGRFIWHELLTADVAGAIEFYAPITGWAVTEMPVEKITYKVFRTDIAPVAALIDTAFEPPGGPKESWISYIGVEDLDAVVAQALRLGGALLQAAVDTPGIGRFAILADPQGAPFGLFAPTPDNAGREQRGAGRNGHVAWHELYSPDPQGGLAFYTQLFGWRTGPVFEMGRAGSYQVILVDGEAAGGIMRQPPLIASPAWNLFVQVDAIAAADRRVRSAPATVIDGLREVPGGDWTLKCADPHGAIFGLVGRKVGQPTPDQ